MILFARRFYADKRKIKAAAKAIPRPVMAIIAAAYFSDIAASGVSSATSRLFASSREMITPQHGRYRLLGAPLSAAWRVGVAAMMARTLSVKIGQATASEAAAGTDC